MNRICAKTVLTLLVASAQAVAAGQLIKLPESVVDTSSVRWTKATNVILPSWRGPIDVEVAMCSFQLKVSNLSHSDPALARLYVPSTGQFHFETANAISGGMQNHWFIFPDKIMFFYHESFSALASTNRVPAGSDSQTYLAKFQDDFLMSYPRYWIHNYQRFAGRFEPYFGEGKITTEKHTGKTTVHQYLSAKGYDAPKILSIGTDGTNAVVAYECIPEISEDRPVLTFDSNFRVVRAELNGQPLILNRTNNIYVRREEDRQRAEAEAQTK